MPLPLVSVIVACRNERSSIEMFLDGLGNQSLVGHSLEAVVADGMSDDGTREVLNEFARRHEWVRVVDNPGRIASKGLNIALRESRGEIVIRMDAHTEYAPDYVAACLSVLAETRASNVGGPARTKGNGYWQQAIGLAFRSPFFSGGARFHDPQYEGPLDTVPYGCWRRETLESVGGFDETLVRNQDDELNFRLIQAGGTIWQSSKICSWYYPRRSLRALAEQYYEYGRWKLAVMAKHRRPAHWRHLAPATALSLLGILTVGALFHPGSLTGLLCLFALYGAASATASAAALSTPSQIRFLPVLPVIFGAVHFSYAAGFLRGVAARLFCYRASWARRDPLAP